MILYKPHKCIIIDYYLIVAYLFTDIYFNNKRAFLCIFESIKILTLIIINDNIIYQQLLLNDRKFKSVFALLIISKSYYLADNKNQQEDIRGRNYLFAMPLMLIFYSCYIFLNYCIIS